MNDREFDELSAGHALHALSAADEQSFQQALAARPDRRAQAERDEAAAAALADTVAEQTPPPALRADLLSRIAVTPQLSPADADTPMPDVEAPVPSARRRPARSSRVWFALAACLALVVAVGAGIVVVAQQMNRPAAVVALERIDGAPDAQTASTPLPDGGEATVHWSSSLGEAVLVSDGLPAIASDKSFEMWIVRDGVPVSAGVFDAAGAPATAQLAGTLTAGDVVAVTVEQQGGSPNGAPTSQPILAIATA